MQNKKLKATLFILAYYALLAAFLYVALLTMIGMVAMVGGIPAFIVIFIVLLFLLFRIPILIWRKVTR